jgi:hypothetical protein
MLAFNVKHKGNPNKDWKPNNRKAYDRTPVQVKVLPGVRERLKTVVDTLSSKETEILLTKQT